MKRCVIFGAGVYDGRPLLTEKDDYIIAADGGYEACCKNGITPDITIGDFDSSDKIPGGKTVKLPVEKDVTDLHAAVEQGIAEGCTEFHIYGGMGGRPDHTMANYTLIAGLAKKGIKAYLYGDKYTVSALYEGRIELSGKIGTTVSVFPWGDKAEGVSYSGLKYPLDNATLINTFCLSVSNSFSEEKASIEVKKGTLLVMQESLY